ncbi:hypothetical protein NPA07_02780 [Mycoplasmopsis caviae]|uniref:Uncharacterized protein n=1 Tax=Mycoplasmopsis caviae TaxID=55603 RepID=A0A3P8LBF6_9BACT|nr:hypothetical protein [Mycoplasmopsis caviae]UUD34724.1 hypothetical protein NPA07_02780 [Mycoplasmopsis caviae]VDR42421.1 Uncharacterised protein [Mycoplasmopsis caviae]
MNNNLLDLNISRDKLEKWASYSTNKTLKILILFFVFLMIVSLLVPIVVMIIYNTKISIIINSIIIAFFIIFWFLLLAPICYLMITSFWTKRAIKQDDKVIFKGYKESNFWIKVQLYYANFGYKMITKKKLHFKKDEFKIFVNFFVNVKE